MPETSKQDFNKKTALGGSSIISPEIARQLHTLSSQMIQEFPDALEDLVIVAAGTSTSKVIFAAPSIAVHMKEAMPHIEQFLKWQNAELRDAAAMSFGRQPLGKMSAQLIAINDDRNDDTSGITPEFTIYSLFHEIGHVVTRKGHSDYSHLRESMADAFATLLYMQKFGRPATEALHMREQTAIGLMAGSANHYTSNTIQAALDFANKTGESFSRLSLRELAEQAAHIADTTAFKSSTLGSIYTAYKPAQEAFYSGGGYKALAQKVIEVMNDHNNDPDILLTGKRALNLPDMKEVVKAEAAAAKDSPFWQDALEFLDDGVSKKTRSVPRLKS